MNSPAQTHTAHIHALYRYPVKGLSPERLEAAAPGRHETLLNDRAYALENGPSGSIRQRLPGSPRRNFSAA
jgi:uncharacterized protein YcbX